VRPPLAIPAAKPDLTTLSEDELRAELAKTTGRVEELQHEKELKEKTHADEIRKSEERIAALEKQLKEFTPDTPKVPEGKTPMEAAKDAYAAANWDEAIVFFSQVLGTEEKGKVAEEATYLRGESYFKKLQYNKAILDYSKFPERFPKSSYHPKALLRIAESFDSMGRKDEAKMFYTDLAEKFPKTAEGRIAKKKLKK
jgi:TolA-binding protein